MAPWSRCGSRSCWARLETREYYSLPYEIRPTGRVRDRADAGQAVNEAIGWANRRSLERSGEQRPTWSTEADPGPDRYVAEIAKGPMDGQAVTEWLSDLASALNERSDRVPSPVVSPVLPDSRVDSLISWESLPSTPSAFMYFEAPGGNYTNRRIDLGVLEATAPRLLDWMSLPGGNVVVQKGQHKFASTPARAVADYLADLADLEHPQFGVYEYRKKPRRLRFANFDYFAMAQLQVFDEGGPMEGSLEKLLDGLRIFGPHLQYASVRRGMVAGPAETDLTHQFGRNPNEVESAMVSNTLFRLLDDHVPDVYVAQVLGRRHLDRITSIELFDVSSLGSERYLVVARDPAPWLQEQEPGEVRARARRDFAALLITTEMVAAQSRA